MSDAMDNPVEVMEMISPVIETHVASKTVDLAVPPHVNRPYADVAVILRTKRDTLHTTAWVCVKHIQNPRNHPLFNPAGFAGEKSFMSLTEAVEAWCGIVHLGDARRFAADSSSEAHDAG